MKNKKQKTVVKSKTPSYSGRRFFAVLFYVILVLGIDALATSRLSWPFDWAVFQWRLVSPWHFLGLSIPSWTQSSIARSFDLFKFLFWLVLPLCFCLPRMEWSWFSMRNWKRLDWLLLGLLLVAGAVAVASVAFIPSLSNVYRGFSHLPWSHRWMRALASLAWVGSWLIGWEFLHRYVLLRSAAAYFPRYGWLVVPLSETLYHLQKPGLEMVGMALFSLVLTWWSLKRQNMLLPFIAHLYIEIMLIVALTFFL
jgi:hypothetical protein